jgi:hypothetical protein
MPVSWKGTVVQYAGRIQRWQPGKHSAVLVDIVDHRVPVLVRMAAKRAAAYRTLGFATPPSGELFAGEA